VSGLPGKGAPQLRVVLLTHQCERAARIADGLAEGGVPITAVVLATPPVLMSARNLLRILPVWSVLVMGLRRLHASLFQPASHNWRRPESYRSKAGRVITVAHLNSDESVAALSALDADVGVVGCSPILRPEVFGAFRLGVLNIHPGLIPEYRGRSPVEWALFEGGNVGVTLHLIDAGIDTGPVVSRRTVPLQAGDTVRAVYGRAYSIGVTLLVETLRRMMRGEEVRAEPQPPPVRKAHGSLPHPLFGQVCRRLAERTRG
jgi:hypothetical protein